ncbi:OLC1v1020784C1 [Oldenlandia corymbosa var. corymbosa]|uniref:OLC1v1020784C1 n=1 Tax=Oldenlandia corymbosa var. corymbosa TaxID=529605 RepID=A0AAV1BU90_OLDCO|nr:OLC1v1020784C1 [Oldenlandia corymbosa var. corymbosa]
MEEEETVTEFSLSKLKASLLPQQDSFEGEASIELKKLIKSTLGWVFFIDNESSLWRSGLSWSMFFLLTICVPLVSHFVFACSPSSSSGSRCDEDHSRPFDGIVQISLSLFAILSFLSLSSFTHKYGLRKFLFLDKLSHESQKVKQGYAQEIHRSMKILSAFVLPCFFADAAYKIWWFSSGGTQIPYFYNVYLSHTIACILLMSSWLYRISISFLVCVLFQLICFLQILRLEDFAQVFERDSDVASILLDHLSIRRNLRIISHRFRKFILFSLILVTGSQFVSLLRTTESRSIVDIFTAGELALCSISLVTGLFICLRSAAKITHKAQSVTSLAAKWHVCSTINSFEEVEGDTPRSHAATDHVIYSLNNAYEETDSEEGDGDDAIDNTHFLPILHALSYQKRQALLTYFEHNRAGITVYGFMLDRSWLHTIFAIQLSLTLWILNKTIGIH